MMQATPDRHDVGEAPAFCPDFLVVGVVKGGTTALYNVLDRHPGIYLPPIKETNFFSRADMHPAEFQREYVLDANLDVARFIRNGMKEVVHLAHVNDPGQYAALYAPARPGQVQGEVCPSYAIAPTAAAAIHAANPAAKIIFMLRDPVKRAWSQYIMNLREGKTMERDFLREVERDGQQAKQGWGINHQYLALGMYAGQVQRFLELFPRNQVHVLLHERFKQDPAGTVRQVLQAIGADPEAELDLSGKFNEAAVPRNAALNRLLVRSGAISAVKAMVPRRMRGGFKELLYSRRHMPALPLDQAKALWELYASDVERLSNMLVMDLMRWWGPDKYKE